MSRHLGRSGNARAVIGSRAEGGVLERRLSLGNGFRVVCAETLQHRAQAIAAAALRALDDPAREQKRGRRKRLAAFSLAGEHYLVKASHYPRGPKAWLRTSKARREWVRAAALRSRGVDTPMPLLWGERRTRTGRLLFCFMVVAALEGARDLAALWALRVPATALRERSRTMARARSFAVLVRDLHERGLWQRDFAPNNFLWVPGPPERIVPIDFERATLHKKLPSGAATAMLAKLYRYLNDVPRSLRYAFLFAYANEDRAHTRRLWREIEAFERTLWRRDLAHLSRTATRSNRRFLKVEGEDASGFARAEVNLDEVLDAIDHCVSAPGSEAWPMPCAIGEVFVHRFSASDAPSPKELAALWATAQCLALRPGLCTPALAALERASTVWWVARRRGDEMVLSESDQSVNAWAARTVLAKRLRPLELRFGEASLAWSRGRRGPARLIVPARARL